MFLRMSMRGNVVDEESNMAHRLEHLCVAHGRHLGGQRTDLIETLAQGLCFTTQAAICTAQGRRFRLVRCDGIHSYLLGGRRTNPESQRHAGRARAIGPRTAWRCRNAAEGPRSQAATLRGRGALTSPPFVAASAPISGRARALATRWRNTNRVGMS